MVHCMMRVSCSWQNKRFVSWALRRKISVCAPGVQHDPVHIFLGRAAARRHAHNPLISPGESRVGPVLPLQRIRNTMLIVTGNFSVLSDFIRPAVHDIIFTFTSFVFSQANWHQSDRNRSVHGVARKQVSCAMSGLYIINFCEVS